MTPGHGTGPEEILIGVIALIVLFLVPLLTTIYTVRFIAKQFQRSLGWGWAGFWSSILVMVVAVLLLNVADATLEIRPLGRFMLLLIVWVLVTWPLGTALAMVPLYLTRKRSQG